MITKQNLSTIQYNFSSPSQFQLVDDIDKTKTLNFDLSQIPPNSVVNLQIPNSNGTFMVLGSNIIGYNATLVNSELTILDNKIKLTSIITATYNGFNPKTQGTLSVDNINPFSSFKIKSTKSNDNNNIFVIVIY